MKQKQPLNLSNEEVREYISQIIMGQKIVEISCNGGSNIYIFRVPRSDIKLRADLFYNQVKAKAIRFGLLTRSQMEKFSRKYEVVDFDFVNKMLEKIERNLEKEKTILLHSRHALQIAEKRRKIYALENEIAYWKSKINFVYWHTAESKAEQQRTLFIICESIYKLDNTKAWNSIADFLQDNTVCQNDIINLYVNFAEGLDVSIIRYIARHPEWSIYWRSLKSANDCLFNQPVTEWDINKLLLVHWSQFYDDIMKSPEPPPQYIIDNDDDLDKWLQDRRIINEHNARRTVSTHDGKIKTTYHVNQPYKLVTQEELKTIKGEYDAGT